MSRRRRRRTWRWWALATAAIAAGVFAWTALRPVPATIPVPGRAPRAASPEPREEITEAEKKRLDAIVERRASE